MARSLQIQHEENVSTSPLLTGFLLFAVFWLAVGAVVSMAADAGDRSAVEADAR